MAEDVVVGFGANITGLTSGITQLREVLQGLSSPIRGMRQNLGELAEAFAAAFAIEKIKEWATEITEAGAQVEHLTHEIGMSAEEISTLNVAFEAMGLGGNAAERMLMRLERNMSQAATGAGPAAAAFTALGIRFDDLKKLSPEEMLNRLADVFSKTADGPNKTAIAMALMGRAGAEMIPFLDRGREGLEEFKAIAERTGTVLTGPMVEGMEKTSIEMTELGKSFTGVSYTLYEAFKPALDLIIKGLTDLVEWFNNSIKSGGSFNALLGGMVAVVDIIVAEIEFWIQVFRVLGDVAMGVIKNMIIAFQTLGAVMSDIIHGKFGSIGEDFKQGWSQAVDVTKSALNDMVDASQRTVDDIKKLMSNLSGSGNVDTTGGAEVQGPNQPKKELPNLAEIQQAQAEAKEAAQDQMKLNQEVFQEESEHVKQLADLGKITTDDKIAQLKVLQSTKAAADAAALESEMRVGGLSVREQQRIGDQIKQIWRTNNIELAKLDTERINSDEKMSEAWFSFQEKMLQGSLTAKKDAIQQEITAEGAGNIKKMEMIGQLDAQIYQSQRRDLEQQMSGYAAGTQQATKYYEDLLQLDQKYAAQKAALDRQIATESGAWAKSAFQTIDTTFDTMLKGVLTGTQTWQQAMAKAFSNMAVSFIESVAKMIAQWLAFKALQGAGSALTGAGATGLGASATAGAGALGAGPLGGLISSLTGGAGGAANSAASTAATTAQTATLTADITTMTATLTADLTAQTATLTTGFTTALTTALAASFATSDAAFATALTALGVSITGAIIAETTALSTILSAILAKPSVLGTTFATGTWSVPSNMVAGIHQGEIIVPAEESSQIRSGQAVLGSRGATGGGGGGGAPNFNFNVNAMDARSMSTAFVNNPTVMRTLATRLGQTSSNNPSLGG